MSQNDMQLFRLYLSQGLVWVCEIELSHMGKNNGIPNLVFEKILSYIARGKNKNEQPHVNKQLTSLSW